MRRGQSLQDDASAYAGAPTDSTSKWSFQRWEEATNGDDSEIRALYVRDREVFYDRIAHDPTFLDGWTGDPSSTRSVFTGLRDHADDRLRYSRYAGEGVWLNHAISALDALRAARLHNVPLGHDLKLRLGSGWSHGRPAFTAALRRDF